MANQQNQKITFGTGRLFLNNAGGSYQGRLPVADLSDVTIDFKTEIKTIFGEGSYAIAAADGHRTIDITAQNYTVNLATAALDLANGATTGASASAFVADENGVVATNTYTLASSGYVAQSLDLIVWLPPVAGVQPGPVRYQVAEGTVAPGGYPVAGKSAWINPATGIITFAAGDNASVLKATYQVANANGSSLVIGNSLYQNSAPTYSMVMFKRDRNQQDGSMGQLIVQLNAVRSMGMKFDFKEDNFNGIARSYQAFADTFGNVATMTFVNV